MNKSDEKENDKTEQAATHMMLASIFMPNTVKAGMMLMDLFRGNKQFEAGKKFNDYICHYGDEFNQKKADSDKIAELQRTNANLKIEIQRMKIDLQNLKMAAKFEDYQRMVDNLVRQIECDMISSSERAVIENFMWRTYPELSTSLRLTDVIDEAYRRRAIALKPVVKLEQKVNNFDAPVKTVNTVVNMKSMVAQEQIDEENGR